MKDNIFENWFQFLFLPGYVRSLHVLVNKVGQGRMELAHRRMELKKVDAYLPKGKESLTCHIQQKDGLFAERFSLLFCQELKFT